MPETPELSVLHVTPYYPPDRIGGVGEVARTIHEGLLGRGIVSEVLSSGNTTTDPLVHRVGKTPARFALSSWRALSLARRFDILHVHHGEAVALLLALRLLRRRPSVMAMFHVDVRRREAADRGHTVADRRFGPRGIKGLLRRLLGAGKALLDRIAWVLADCVVVETAQMKRELSDLRPEREVHVVPYGVERQALVDHSPATTELLYVGTSGNRKRTHLLPEILSGVRKVFPAARLRIVGFWADTDTQLSSEIDRLGLSEAVEFVGPLTSPEVAPYYRAARVLVLPSAYEGLPMVLLEAMLEGLVPVATDISGHPDAIQDGVCGFMVPVDDVQAMADRCCFLLENSTMADQMSRRARDVVGSRFTVEGQIGEFVRLYSRLSVREGS